MKKLLKEDQWCRAKIIGVLPMVFVACIFAASAQANSTGAAGHPAATISEQLHNAIASGDAEALRSLIAPEVMIFESGGAEASLSEYEGHHMAADIAFMKDMSREITSQQVIDAGNSAVVMTRSKISGVYKEKSYDLTSAETLVVENIAGNWMIVHIHWSSK